MCKGRAVRCEKQEMSIQIRISPDSHPFSETAWVNTVCVFLFVAEMTSDQQGRNDTAGCRKTVKPWFSNKWTFP